MEINKISEIEKYTVSLYREKFKSTVPVGSGILVCINGINYLVSAYHVFDMDDDRIKIEEDPDEANITQDDMDGILAKGRDCFFYVNDNAKGQILSAHYDSETKEPVFTDDIEWCVCKLSDCVSQYFIENGKAFYQIMDFAHLKIKSVSEIIISGYPAYAQKSTQEVYRSFKCTLIKDFHINKEGLFRVKLDRINAYCVELGSVVQIPKTNGIRGMSGGGLWYKNNDHYIPLGIIIKQDQENDYVEGYNIAKILESYNKVYE